ncbi:glucose-6-phosphate dehydrogenase [Bacteroidota bacterium]
MDKTEGFILVIFGASGDLTKRKLIPALFNLDKNKFITEKYAIIGTGRTKYTDEEFREFMKNAITEFGQAVNHNNENLEYFLEKLNYISFDSEDTNEYETLESKIDDLSAKMNMEKNCIFYLSTPPKLYSVIPKHLAYKKLNKSTEGWRRLIIEKPFGYDFESAQRLNLSLLEDYEEEQIYRIDHYLGKETVQNILVTRFSNGIFEPLWNRNYVHHVEITSCESIGIEKRGNYYDKSGALRDMVQNHLMQIVGLVAMEPPSSFDSDSIRNESLKVFQSLKPLNIAQVNKDVIRGQYTESDIRGRKALGYRDEEGVNPNSETETYVALKFYIDNWRWGGIPFYIRTGKRLPTKVTEVVIHFKPTPHWLFGQSQSECDSCNQLVLRLQPDEGILLKFGMKIPGKGFEVRNVNMNFHYSELGDITLSSAYERLLHDSMLGDSTLYTRGDAIEKLWKFLKPIQQAWLENPDIPLYGYPAGTWGPEKSDDLIEDINMTWRYPCKNLTDDDLYCEL